MTNDEVLMLEFQRGSRAAFEELYSRYCGPLYGFFRRRLENPQRAEDLAQETFLAVIRAAPRYEARSLVRTYLYGISLKLLAAERRRLIRVGAPAEPATEPVTGSPPETALWVRQALERLDASEREILMLRELHPDCLREWAYARSYENSQQRAQHLPGWLHHYNWHRPHASLRHVPPISRSGLEANNLLRHHS